MLKQFSERVAKRAGFDVTWIMMIAEIITEIISQCQNQPQDLARAIDNPTFLQALQLRARCRREHGWRDGRKMADAILDEAMPFKKDSLAGLDQGNPIAFEEAVLAEVAMLMG